jgi:Heterokaryon incompatibility protein (HET)
MVLASATAFQVTNYYDVLPTVLRTRYPYSKITARMIASEKIRQSNLGGAFPSLDRVKALLISVKYNQQGFFVTIRLITRYIMGEFIDPLTLCSYCQKINFDGLIRSDPPRKNGLSPPRPFFKLGLARELLKRTGECHLCHIFGMCLLEAWTGTTSLHAEEIKCQLGQRKIGDFPSGENWKSVYVLNFTANEGPIPWSLDEPYCDVELRFQAVTQTLLAELSALKPAPLRPRPPQCDFTLLKTWLGGCEADHGSLCASSTSNTSADFRLVDTSSRCIVKASILPGTERYLALSYVWGASAQGWCLTMKWLEAVGKERFLDTVSLPTTISDAIELVCRLGERFLWVDSLCILQDSEEDKLQQISRMSSIYEQALITIIAASATDANGGLPGVQPGTRKSIPYVLRTKELILVSCLEAVQMDSDRDVWAWPIDERKWTFQEDVFSRRCLFFFEEQIYWRCKCTTWSEEMLLQPTEHSPFDDWENSFLEARSLYIEKIKTRDTEKFARRYRDLVSIYSARSTTYPADALHGFQGVLSIISRQTDIAFIVALPVPGFNSHLLWDLPPGPEHWYMESETTFPRNALFPSWSWLGWDRHVEMPCKFQIPELECYILDCDGVCVDLPSTGLLKIDCDEKRIQTRPRATARSPAHPALGWKREDLAVTTRDVLTWHVTASLVGRFHLFFWTSLASLYVCRDPDHDETAVHLPMGNRGALSSSEYMSAETPAIEDTKCLELGRQVAQWRTKKGPIAGARPSRQPFIVVGSFLTEESRELYIMMIRWKDGIAQRQCITLINERDWMDADRDWRLIVLG